MANESPLKQLVSKINSVNNILVTVSRNPSVDQLTSALGLSLALNKLGKRSVAVFSGEVPPSIHFLHPEKTFESNADSLRDFIISLNKDKADRLQVRPEGDFVKVYITPYRTKITPDDLKFSDGNFNIELIIAIGVASRDELDASVASHGKIFHNAVIATLNLEQLHDALGMISWQGSGAGCYAEMCYSLIDNLAKSGKNILDEPAATALLTGVVSATDQFRNNITSPEIMTLSANLMAKGANQQLITSELEAAHDSAQSDKVVETGKRDEVVADEPAPLTFDIDNTPTASAVEAPLPTIELTQPTAEPEPTPAQPIAEPVNPAPESVITESVAAESTPLPTPTPTPTEPVPEPAASERPQYVEDPLSQVTGLATAADGATGMTDSGSYIIGDNTTDAINPSSNIPNSLPFNMPNQVSPLAQPAIANDMPPANPPVPPAPPIEQPLPTPPLPPLPPVETIPTPPAPEMTNLPPVPPAPPVEPTLAPPASPTPAPHDPSQFVIPS